MKHQSPSDSTVSEDAARQRIYPGESATAVEIKKLADEYRTAAHHLCERGRRGSPLSWAPYRLIAIQAIELYLNALLLHQNHEPSNVRGLQHNLSLRADMAIAAGLKLRKLTAVHLHALNANREYLTSRYNPELNTTTSQPNRLAATLDEVAKKVSFVIMADSKKSPPLKSGAASRSVAASNSLL